EDVVNQSASSVGAAPRACGWRGGDSSVVYRVFVRPPRSFEAAESYVRWVGPTEIQSAAALISQVLDRLPEAKIVRAKPLGARKRRAEFIESAVAVAEKDCRGNAACFPPHCNDESAPTSDNFLVDVAEKAVRLRRRSVTAASIAMEPVKISDRFAAGFDLSVKPVVFCLANAATQCALNF
ncbi:MAG: hypothetical protein M3Z36_08360, partial [Acidobacteriota bacterium]|nr:hypothetical protein [Acidobacteriota bacterium]